MTVTTLSVVRHTLSKNGGVVHTLTGGHQGPPGPTGATGSSDVAVATHAATSKATPVDADELPLADSAAAFGLKKLTWASLKAAIWAAWGALIAGGTAKATPVDADALALMDSAAANATKKLTWASLKATLKAYFDTVYPPTANPTFTGLITTGGQIKFPATQVPSADPNTLDDYEEGTFTPTIAFGGASVGVSYLSQSGKYTKIGNKVTFKLRIQTASKGSSVGALTIGGLPFTSDGSDSAIIQSWVDYMTGLSGNVVGRFTPAGTSIAIDYNGTGTNNAATDANCTANVHVQLSGTYFV